MDAVIIATPHYFHPPIAIEAMKAGLHVISEKPMAVQVSQADEMIQAAKETGKVFGVMFNVRSVPDCRPRKSWSRKGGWARSIARCCVDAYFRSQAYYDSATWRATWKGEGGGVLMNQAPALAGPASPGWAACPPASRPTPRRATTRSRSRTRPRPCSSIPMARRAMSTRASTRCPGTSRIELCGENGKLVLDDGKLHFWEVPGGRRPSPIATDQMWGSPERREVRGADRAARVRPRRHRAQRRPRHHAWRAADQPQGSRRIRRVEVADAMILSGDTGKPVRRAGGSRRLRRLPRAQKGDSKDKAATGPVKRITDPRFSKK